MVFKKGHVSCRKLPDVVAACNIIKSRRINNRVMKKKSIRINFENDFGVYIRTHIYLRPTTQKVSCAHSLAYKGIQFYPTKNKKLKCTNSHALDYLDYNRRFCKEYAKKKRNK